MLCILPVVFKVMFTVIVKKVIDDIFIKNVILIKLIQEQSDLFFTYTFCKVLN